MTSALAPPSLDAEQELNWLALVLVNGLGPKRAASLIRQFGSPDRIFQASRSELEASGLTSQVAFGISGGHSYDEAIRQQRLLRASDANLLTLTDPRYPTRLKEIYDPPVVLFLRGRAELLNSVCLAVVGTRRPTTYGSIVAARIGADLAAAGATVVSGMARGIDTAAHKACLEAGGDTIAVFGCGADIVYPQENKKLADDIAARGLIVSEFPLGTPGYPQNFPVRNRIVAGLSASVCVVEGAQYSGSAITAKMALEQGRDVFAVPGNITSKNSWGPNLLIKEGAKLLLDPRDLIEELGVADRRHLTTRCKLGMNPDGQPEAEPPTEGSGSAAMSPEQASLFSGAMGPVARDILAALSVDQPLQMDRLAESLAHRSASELLATLFDLELAGLIRQLPGRNFVKVWGVFS